MTEYDGGHLIEILLVEDSPSDTELTIEALSEAKVANHLSAVQDGVQALAFLRRENEYAAAPRPDLILLDLNLPRKDGREVLAELKADPKLKTIPVRMSCAPISSSVTATSPSRLFLKIS